jgi:hypothetical protein
MHALNRRVREHFDLDGQCRRNEKALALMLQRFHVGTADLFADQDQNARHKRQDSHHNCPDDSVEKRVDSAKNQIDSEQQHSNVFCHASFSEATPMRLHA